MSIIKIVKNVFRSLPVNRLFLLAVGVSAAGVITLSIPARPALAGHTPLAVLPAPLLMGPGDQDVLDLWVFGLDDTDRLTGYSVTLDYDPAVITVDGVSGGNAPFDQIPTSSIDNGSGRVTISPNRTRGGAAEDALLARISVSAVGELDASTALRFSGVELKGSLDQAIAVGSAQHGRAEVSNAAVMIGTSSVALGQSTTVPVTVVFTPKGGLAGYNISVGYNPAVIRIDGILPGEAPFSGSPIFSVTQEQGFVNIVGFHGERPGPVGRTVVLNIQVTGMTKGASPLDVTIKDLVNAMDATSWPATASSGSVRVVAESPGGSSAPALTPNAISLAMDGRSALDGAVVSDVTPTGGTVISLPKNNVTLTIPPGAVKEVGFVAMRESGGGMGSTAPPSRDLGNVVEVNLLDAQGTLLTDVYLLEQAVLRMGFSSADLEISGPNGISIQRYEPVLGRWLPLDTTVDTSNLPASARTDRFSVFGLTFQQQGTAAPSDSSLDQNGPEAAPPVSGSSSAGDSGTPAEQAADSGTADGPISMAVIALIALAVIGVVVVGYLFLREKETQTAPGQDGI
ncbi:MAG: cohesin domain-containing protein [Chloroflexi bacterium]|nr:cohesin domain-containing protein [Chloroflexota bacterium]